MSSLRSKFELRKDGVRERFFQPDKIADSLNYAAQSLKIDDFMDIQASAIYSVVLSGEDVFVSLPTGF